MKLKYHAEKYFSVYYFDNHQGQNSL